MIERGVLVHCKSRGAGILTDIFTDKRREVAYVTGQREILSDESFDVHREWAPTVLYPGQFVMQRALKPGEIEKPPTKGTPLEHSIRGHGVVHAVLPKGDRVIHFKHGEEATYPQHCWGEHKPSQLNASNRNVLRKWSKTSAAVAVDQCNSLDNRMLRMNLQIYAQKKKAKDLEEKEKSLRRSQRGGGESLLVQNAYTSNSSPSDHMRMAWPDDALPAPLWVGLSSQKHLPAQAKLALGESKLLYQIQHKTTVESLLRLVESHVRRCKFQEAVDVANQALDIFQTENHQDPVTKAQLLYYTGKAHLELGSYPESREAFDRATKLHPSYAEAWAGWSTVILRETKPLMLDTRGELDKANADARASTKSLDAFESTPPAPLTEEWINQAPLLPYMDV